MKKVFNDFIMQSQYEELCRTMPRKEAKKKVLNAHKEYYGKSAKFYGLD